MAGNTVANLFRDMESRDEHRALILLKNALRVKELLGQLKGVHKANGDLMPWQMAADFADVFQEFFDPETHYTYGDDEKIYARLYELGNKHTSESMSMAFPKDIIFIDRTFGGHFGNLCRLNA